MKPFLAFFPLHSQQLKVFKFVSFLSENHRERTAITISTNRFFLNFQRIFWLNDFFWRLFDKNEKSFFIEDPFWIWNLWKMSKDESYSCNFWKAGKKNFFGEKMMKKGFFMIFHFSFRFFLKSQVNLKFQLIHLKFPPESVFSHSKYSDRNGYLKFVAVFFLILSFFDLIWLNFESQIKWLIEKPFLNRFGRIKALLYLEIY